jgi:hypothetical protein
MSEGPGHIQRAILELISAEPDGAWQTSEICHRVYGWCGLEYSRFFSALKGERAAVSRALRTMKLPGNMGGLRVTHEKRRVLALRSVQ